ncbi:hypothetical protein NUW54_g12435 [Trametes sanguinea]|uniref:Uncharacterized protein n=1 Tax=Trametes sanguinea TaxID=158606 RepID=A0ACC1MY40_9APHY|nr:hypothetical protein NUW54_g12435 [Trametes sanguinea]
MVWCDQAASSHVTHLKLRNLSRAAGEQERWDGGELPKRLVRPYVEQSTEGLTPLWAERSRAGSSFYGGYKEEEEGVRQGRVQGASTFLPLLMYGRAVTDGIPPLQLHYREEVCGMALLPETRYEEFMNMVQRKFDVVPGALGMEFKDDDGARLRSGRRWTSELGERDRAP